MNILHYLFPLFITGTFAIPVKYDQRQDGEVNVRADLQNFVIVALIPKLDGASAGTAILNAISKTFPERKSDKLSIRRHALDSEEELPNARNEPFTEKKNTPYHVDITQGKATQTGRKSSAPLSLVSKLKKLPGLSVESPVPVVLPVKDNKYVLSDRKNVRRSLEYNNDIVEYNSETDDVHGISLEDKDDDAPQPPKGVQYWLLGSRDNCGPGAYRDASLLCVPCPQGQSVEYETGICKDL